jgi:hypothetical protein
VWKILIVNGQRRYFMLNVSANAHGFIPIFFGQPIEDGLDFQTKSFATNVTDMQDIASCHVERLSSQASEDLLATEFSTTLYRI